MYSFSLIEIEISRGGFIYRIGACSRSYARKKGIHEIDKPWVFLNDLYNCGAAASIARTRVTGSCRRHFENDLVPLENSSRAATLHDMLNNLRPLVETFPQKFRFSATGNSSLTTPPSKNIRRRFR
jgi:hypothetical protein